MMPAAEVSVESRSDSKEPGEKFFLKRDGFRENYAENAHLQKRFNTKIISGLIESIVQWFPQTDTCPLSILDLCCGDGGSTYELLQGLTAAGVRVQELVAYDISKEQIKKATEYSQQDSRLKFVEQNVEKMTTNKKYDIIISLYGFHWMEDLEGIAKKIQEALQPRGKIVFFVPLEKTDLFKIRTNFMSSEKWKPHFQNYSIHPFISDAGDYIQVFDKHFFNSQYHRGTETKEYSEEAFIKFLLSWMQEGRHIADEQMRLQYVRELVQSIPENIYPNVSRTKKEDKNDISFTEHFFYFSANKEKQRNLSKKKKDGVQEAQPLSKSSESMLWSYKLTKYAMFGAIGLVAIHVARRNKFFYETYLSSKNFPKNL